MTLSKIIEQLKAADQNKSGMFELGEDVMCALVDLLELRERDGQEPAPQIKNLEHFIAFWRKVQGGHILPSKNDIDHTVWFMEGLADIAAPPAPVVSDDFMDAEFRKFVLSKNYAVEDGGVLWGNLGFGAAVEAWQACRAAMLKQQSSIQACNSACSGAEIKQPASNGQSFGNSEQLNSPVTPVGWVMVPIELTPRMITKLQQNTEIGSYIAANWAGAYGLFQKFWDEAIAAAPKQESE